MRDKISYTIAFFKGIVFMASRHGVVITIILVFYGGKS